MRPAASLTSHRQLRESTFRLSVNMSKHKMVGFGSLSPRTNCKCKQLLGTGERIHFHLYTETQVLGEPGKSGVSIRERRLGAYA